MNTEINLAIKRKKTETLLSTAKVKKLRLFGMIFLFAVGGLSAVLFLIIASSPLPALRVQEQEASSTLDNYQAKFGEYLLLKSQLASIQSVLDSRPDLSKAIDTFTDLIPPGVSVSGVEITEGSLAFGVSSQSLSAIQSFFTSIKDKESQLPRSITTSAIGYDPNAGVYSFTIDFQ